MKRKIESIPLDLIKLDQENVRFGGDTAQNQREAIDFMMADPEDAKKLLRLADHIAEHGLDPTELQLVTPDTNGHYIVLEGNRRLTALKLLQKPDLCPDGKLIKGFSTAQNKMTSSFPAEIVCSVVPSRSAGDMWVELKHTGQNGGVGRVNWDSDIRDERRARQTGVESIGRQIRNLVKNNLHVFSSHTVSDIFAIPVTTLTRLFSSKPAQEVFQIKIENKELIPALALEYIAPSLEFAVNLFRHHDYNVNDIRSDEDRWRFVKRIPTDLTPLEIARVAHDEKISGKNGALDDKTSNNIENGKSDKTDAENTSSIDRKTKVESSSQARKYLFPWPLSINNFRINKIYGELRKILEVDKSPNAAAITFRVFIEVSCDDFSKKESQAGNPVVREDNNKQLTADDKLSVKVKSVVQHLATQGKLTKQESRAIYKRASAHDSIGSVDHFNQFVHSSASAPIPSELKDIADEYRPMLVAIWE